MLLRRWRGVEPVLQEAARFYRTQLHRHSEEYAYLYRRGIRSAALIEKMRIGHAPGGCLRGWLTQLGHSLPALCQTGLVTEAGDAYMRRIVFPLEGNLYGRSLSAAAPPDRFLPGAKGGLYLWEQVQSYPEVILVEGLFDYAAVWQAGFQNVTCSLGPISICASFGSSATPRGYRGAFRSGSDAASPMNMSIEAIEDEAVAIDSVNAMDFDAGDAERVDLPGSGTV